MYAFRVYDMRAVENEMNKMEADGWAVVSTSIISGGGLCCNNLAVTYHRIN